MSLLGPAFLDAASGPRPVAGAWRAIQYRPPAIAVPDALEQITEHLDELLDTTAVELAPFADDLSEALELLRNVNDKVADDRADRSAAA